MSARRRRESHASTLQAIGPAPARTTNHHQPRLVVFVVGYTYKHWDARQRTWSHEFKVLHRLEDDDGDQVLRIVHADGTQEDVGLRHRETKGYTLEVVTTQHPPPKFKAVKIDALELHSMPHPSLAGYRVLARAPIVKKGMLPSLNGMTATEFVAALADYTLQEASVMSNMVFASTLDDGDEDAYRRSWTIPLASVARRMALRKYLSQLDAFAHQMLLEAGASNPRPRRAHGQRDGSLVLYERGQYYRVHGDAEGLQFPTRAWTFVVYLHCPGSQDRRDGGLEFPDLGLVLPCVTGRWVLWSNYHHGFPNPYSQHEALSVTSTEDHRGISMYAVRSGKGREALHIRKIVLNLWFDEEPTTRRKADT